MYIAQKIKQLRKSKNLLQKELAAKIGVTAEAISFWESGIRMPRPKQLKKLAKFFGVTEGELFGAPSQKIYEVKETKIPIISSVGPTDEFGNPKLYAFEPPYQTIPLANCKAVIVESNSLAPLVYKGQKIIFSETESVNNGDLVFIKLKNGERLFKGYYKNHKNNMLTLQSINSSVAHEPVLLNENEIQSCYKIVGVLF